MIDNMTERDQDALKELYKLNGQKKYKITASWTCTKEFKESFPKDQRPKFTPDGLPKQIGGRPGSRTL